MRNIQSQIFLLLLTCLCSLMADAGITLFNIPTAAENASSPSSSRAQFVIPEPDVNQRKPLILYSGAEEGDEGGDGHGGGYGGTPFVPVIVFGNTPSSGKAEPQGKSSGPGDKKTTSKKEQPSSGLPSTGPHQENSGAGSNPPPGEDFRSRLEEAVTMLRLLDQLFEQTNESVTLVTDLDGTLLAQDYEDMDKEQSLRQLFKEFVEKWRNRDRLTLVIVTAAALGKGSWPFFWQNQLPDPDVLIAKPLDWEAFFHVQCRRQVDVSRLFPGHPPIPEVQVSDRGFTISNYFRFVMGAAQRLPGLLRERGYGHCSIRSVIEHSQQVCEASFSDQDVTSDDFRQSIHQLVFDLCGIMAKVSFDPDNKTIRITLPVGKGGYVSRLASVLSFSGTTVIAAGNDVIDLPMMIPAADSGYEVDQAIVVSNATRRLRDALPGLDTRHVYQARRPCLHGVIEGMVEAMKKRVADN